MRSSIREAEQPGTSLTERPGTYLTLSADGRGAGDSLGALVKAPEKRVVVEDVPDLVLHLLEADVLTVECLRQEDLAAVESEGAAVANAPDLDVAG
jgi:hypothetical protein